MCVGGCGDVCLCQGGVGTCVYVMCMWCIRGVYVVHTWCVCGAYVVCMEMCVLGVRVCNSVLS